MIWEDEAGTGVRPLRPKLYHRRHLAVIPPWDDGPPEDTSDRPKTRADCKDGPRPCPWAACQFNTRIDVGRDGSIVVNWAEIDQMAESCVLDVADRGLATLAEVGAAMNVTRERIRQIEAVALRKVRGSRTRCASLDE